MSRGLRWVIFISCFNASLGLYCYNCTSTQTSWNHCAGDFAPPYREFNTSRKFLANCSGENPMCFVRSWRARARHAWIVQRGCYESTKDDPLPQYMSNPTRAMTCKHQKLPEAEYNVCLCQADWCNSATLTVIPHTLLLHYVLGVLAYVFNLCSRTL